MMHSHGISREKVEAIPQWRNSNVFDPLERLVMEYAEALTKTPPTVDDELVRRLRGHFDETQFVELTAIVCLENLRSRRNTAFGMMPQGFKARCDVPQPRQQTHPARQAAAPADHRRPV
jgi:alkylhydroperoxidase family enzyme